MNEKKLYDLLLQSYEAMLEANDVIQAQNNGNTLSKLSRALSAIQDVVAAKHPKVVDILKAVQQKYKIDNP